MALLERVNALIEDLSDVDSEMDWVVNAESNWHTASRLSFKCEELMRCREALEEISEYLSTLTPWQRERLHEAYTEE